MEKIKQEPLPDIWNEDDFESIRTNIRYWTNPMEGYNCHIFTCQLTTEQLFEFWNTITAFIATRFQAELKLEVERWNIYLIFLTKAQLTAEIKYRIEQDKYCCRKLVEDGLQQYPLSDQEIILLMEKNLFSI